MSTPSPKCGKCRADPEMEKVYHRVQELEKMSVPLLRAVFGDMKQRDLKGVRAMIKYLLSP